nr:hypothetical protein TetV2_00587 [Oceanusvirus sp.]
MTKTKYLPKPDLACFTVCRSTDPPRYFPDVSDAAGVLVRWFEQQGHAPIDGVDSSIVLAMYLGFTEEPEDPEQSDDSSFRADKVFDSWQQGKTLERVGKPLREARHPLEVFDFALDVDPTLHPLYGVEDDFGSGYWSD